ncbi:probable linoleate 9S-lipoxygenase 5 [Solanum dulcamara]|uniref:probable linoleate 9S-lipoxygenase 5 n=1 Tax=Solanum dulcamara TaxID=45834 RepID=UPI002484E394|nr:probable linoleate 9S-lipoxygenase 5 [Solanum dulcamara]
MSSSQVCILGHHSSSFLSPCPFSRASFHQDCILHNRPSLSRMFMPEPGSPEYEELKTNSDKVFLKTIVPLLQTMLEISIFEVLSRHASDTLFLGQRDSPERTKDQEPLLAFERYGKKLSDIGDQIMQMNGDHEKSKNRSGPAKVPYTLLFPTSEEGLTGKGIPNSIYIYQIKSVFSEIPVTIKDVML